MGAIDEALGMRARVKYRSRVERAHKLAAATCEMPDVAVGVRQGVRRTLHGWDCELAPPSAGSMVTNPTTGAVGRIFSCCGEQEGGVISTRLSQVDAMSAAIQQVVQGGAGASRSRVGTAAGCGATVVQ